MLKTIVVGVDGREGGRDALALAGRLALLAGGELVAVRALPFDTYVGRGGGPQYNSLADAEAQRQVEQDLAEAGLTARTRLVPDASPARALHRMAEAVDADVIVVGSTRHGAVGGVFAGDDAAATLHASSCAVAVAPRGLADEEWKPVNRIGVGLNASAEAHQALATRGRAGRRLRRVARRADRCRRVARRCRPHGLRRRSARAVQGARQAGAGRGREGPCRRGIRRCGRGHTRGRARRALPHRRPARPRLAGVGARCDARVIGSTAAKLMRRAHCPVLVLPRGAATGQPGERDPGAARVEPSIAT